MEVGLKSLQILWLKVASECATWCCTSALRDYQTVSERVEHEGDSFLTITLPSFGKDFERSLERGFVGHDLFAGFGWQAGLPVFLGGFLDLVFDRATGVLLENPDITAIRSIRQLTLMFGKIELPCAPHRVRAALEGYIETEQEVKVTDSRLSPFDYERISRMARSLFGDVFSDVEQQLLDGETLPKHGPGSTADGLVGNQKYLLDTWTYRLEQYFPFVENVVPNWSLSNISDQMDGVDYLDPGREPPVKVITVPKTLKTPRIIAMEPTHMMYVQQALLRSFNVAIRDNDPSRRIIGTDDQTPNQEMALEGSLSGELATLDLSEASDRVSVRHVHAMFANHPALRGAVMACRSTKAWIKELGVTMSLSKYASMGSALTFPLEAMVFATVVFLGIEDELGHQLDRLTVRRYAEQVRIFGDDIIVPREFVHSVIDSLEYFGFKVNTNKSFWTGRFRESCGKEYYDGEDVSLVRVRHALPTSRRDAQEMIALVSFRNQLYHAGYWQTCRSLDEEISRILDWYPVVSKSSPVLGRNSFLGFRWERVSRDTHSPLVKGYRVRATIPSNPLTGRRALTKCLLQLEVRDDIEVSDLPSPDKEHLERSGRPKSISIKLGWYNPG